MPKSNRLVLLLLEPLLLMTGMLVTPWASVNTFTTGLVDNETIQIPLLVQHRNNANAHLGVSHLEQRRIWIRSGSVYRQAVEIQAEVRKMESEIL